MIKCLLILYTSSYALGRYKQTYKTKYMFEVWMFIAVSIMTIKLIIFEFIVHNLNLLFYIFLINSGLRISTCHTLIARSFGILENGRHLFMYLFFLNIFRLKMVTGCECLLLGFILLASFIPHFGLKCHDYIYRK